MVFRELINHFDNTESIKLRDKLQALSLAFVPLTKPIPVSHRKFKQGVAVLLQHPSDDHTFPRGTATNHLFRQNVDLSPSHSL
jgi:hypothetical protein